MKQPLTIGLLLFTCIQMLSFYGDPDLLAAETITLKPFTTDGCSRFPDGTLANNHLWLRCCIEHDRAYWQGGTAEQREAADQELEDCVAATGEIFISKLMHFGVRAGGVPYIPTSYRWGYGWPFPRGYKPLSEHEKEAIRQALKSSSHD